MHLRHGLRFTIKIDSETKPLESWFSGFQFDHEEDAGQKSYNKNIYIYIHSC